MANISLPEKLSALPRVQLLFPHASPIERLSELTTFIRSTNPGAVCPDLWIKREDCNSGLALGGNKLRKLEYVIADALAHGHDTLVTTGGIQSNHMRQTAAAGNKYHLQTHLVPSDRVQGRGPEYYSLGNVQLDHLLGATVHRPGSTMDEVAEELRAEGKKPYLIPSGASTHPLGGVGYARCAFEIIAQETEMQTFFDTIVLATAGGSTMAGLVAGFALAAEAETSEIRARNIIGIDVFAAEETSQQQLLQSIIQNTGKQIGLKAQVPASSYRVERRFNAGSYGHVDDRTADSIKLLAKHEGIFADPVYTGKAFAGMATMAAAGELKLANNVLFIHTGGQASLSAYESLR